MLFGVAAVSCQGPRTVFTVNRRTFPLISHSLCETLSSGDTLTITFSEKHTYPYNSIPYFTRAGKNCKYIFFNLNLNISGRSFMLMLRWDQCSNGNIHLKRRLHHKADSTRLQFDSIKRSCDCFAS